MSTMTLSPQFAPEVAQRPALEAVPPLRPVAPAARVRLTRRGRAMVTLVFLGALMAGMISLGGWATASLSGGTPAPVQVVEVQSGDTLYKLASRVAEPGEVREMVYRIQELNSLPGAQISEGQRLAVPRG
jgi:hypothetical protein